ncbi:MAG: hypothetical protein Q8R82_12555, partial [Hyphomonadaceae bacterium]|nr:hypothetical protein [Hyphomonadaceae bacterium]
IEERGPFFTAKAANTAARRKISLVRTIDLLPVVHEIIDGAPEAYKLLCRKCIFEGAGGLVVFPKAFA